MVDYEALREFQDRCILRGVNPWLLREAMHSVALSHDPDCTCKLCGSLDDMEDSPHAERRPGYFTARAVDDKSKRFRKGLVVVDDGDRLNRQPSGEPDGPPVVHDKPKKRSR